MNNINKNKFLTWMVAALLVANAVTILFFWINRPERIQGPKGSPREFLVHALELDSSQLIAFQDLIEGHQASARSLKKEIRTAKENLFQLLKQPVIPEAEKMNAVKAITLNIQALELLNLEHFQQLRALCNQKQKKKFDGLLDQLAGLMTDSRTPRDNPLAPPNNPVGHPPPHAADNIGEYPPAGDHHRPFPSPGKGHRPPPGKGHRPPPSEGHPPHGAKSPLPPPNQQ